MPINYVSIHHQEEEKKNENCLNTDTSQTSHKPSILRLQPTQIRNLAIVSVALSRGHLNLDDVILFDKRANPNLHYLPKNDTQIGYCFWTYCIRDPEASLEDSILKLYYMNNAKVVELIYSEGVKERR